MGGSGDDTAPEKLETRIGETIRRYWGFERLRPLQQEAIDAGLAQRDSLVVMPTGGGKSLCYQVPALVAGRLDVVVSPLISLMKDQVDGLAACGYPAAAIHSNLTAQENREVVASLRRGEVRLLFVSPERLSNETFLELIEELDVRAFAVDEAHCISHWGHDFRQDYRQLAMLKDRFPGVSIHAFTATATPRVRQDIVDQLRLERPEVLVGSFDRPNLTYRILPRVDLNAHVLEVIRRQYRSWELQASYTYARSIGDGEDYLQGLGNDSTTIEDEFGYQSDDRRHAVKVNATTVTPWGIRLGGSMSWKSGLPYSRLERTFSVDSVPPILRNVGRGSAARSRLRAREECRAWQR